MFTAGGQAEKSESGLHAFLLFLFLPTCPDDKSRILEIEADNMKHSPDVLVLVLLFLLDCLMTGFASSSPPRPRALNQPDHTV